MNDRFTQNLGYRLDDLPTLEQALELVLPDPDFRNQIRSKLHKDLERAIDGNTDINSFECPLRCGDGTLRTMVVGASLIGGSIIASFFDVTDRRRADAEIRRLAALVRNSGELVNLADLDGRMVFLNEAGSKILGIDSEEVEKTNIMQVIPEHLKPLVEKEVLPALQAGGSWQGELQYLNLKTGEMTDVQALSFIIDDPDASRRQYLANISLDISQMKKTEEKFTKVFMTSPDMIAITRATDGLIADVNLGFEKITGWKRSEVIGRTSNDLDFWVDPAGRDEMVEALKASRDVVHREVTFRRKDGSLRTGIYSARSIQIEDQACLIFILQDVTEQKAMESERLRLEQRLFQSQKMEAIGTLAGGIAHDFNNILSVILGFSELCLNEMQDRPKTYKNMEQALKAANRAKDLVKQILTFSRKVEHEKKPIALSPIIREVVQFMRASLPATIEIVQTIEETSDLIMADPTQIHQVLMNLCANAGHAMRKGGLLEIGLKTANMNAENPLLQPPFKSGRYLELFVRDTGHGISKENLAHIFDPYFTTKKSGEGTGLGLAVVHGIVKDHGGDIRVYSEEGKGAVFRIYLPLIEDQGKLEEKIEEAVLQGKGEMILLVDDEQMLADMNRELLERIGYRAVAATDPRRAIEVFKEKSDQFDIVITDKTMPYMTGFDLAREIRAVRADMPVLICSGLQEKGDTEKLASLGIRQFITKPARINTLSKAIRDELENKETP